MSSLAAVELADSQAREAALDTGRSILVQAPAGSGKTELLTTRFLKLLAEVDEPEEVLAITFTKSATAEMRHRILKKLDRAKRPGADDSAAAAALANSNARGWRLLDQPTRLNIQTIDSLCLRIAHRMPLAARLGGTLNPTERAEPLYRRAARRAFDRLGGEDSNLNRALEALLLLRDSNLANCEALIAKMLSTRDQWAHIFPLSGNVDWQAVRARMEAPFQREVHRVLRPAHALLSEYPEITAELLELANYACQTEDLRADILALAGLTSLPPHTSPEHWACIANFLLKKSEDAWLLKVNKHHGFPAGGKTSLESLQKDRRNQLIANLQEIPGLFDLLGEIRRLPPPNYTDEQWQTLRHLFTTLRRAVLELDTVFAEGGAVDFIQVGMSAQQVLQGDLAQTENIRHLLVDEFQDTSRRQHGLIASLLRNWSLAEGRTLFLVGDPMQSIYMFRQADVELFDIVRQRGLALDSGTLPVESLRLATNFRSNAGVVNPLNEMFGVLFPHHRKRQSAGVDFLPGIAYNRDQPKQAYQVHPRFVCFTKRNATAASDNESDPAKEAERKETAEILGIVQRHLPRIELARVSDAEFTIAILGRAKNHLSAIGAALRREQIPFRAVELETLGERPEILDLQSITRALLHPMDRIAWLALLRAPWCGLELGDLHRLCDADRRESSHPSAEQQIHDRLHLLREDARQRATRVIAAMDAARRHRYAQLSFSSWIERTWTSLGGPDCVDEAGYENALAYFSMLDSLTADGIAATGEEMDDRLNKLFAKPDPHVSDRRGLQLMTIHKAKGLGFNVVIVPALHKKGGSDEQQLIQYLERTTSSGTELLVAPIGEKGEDSSSLYKWVCRQKKDREAEERKRLLYVACTRAREELHLFATATVTSFGLGCQPGSLLSTAWPALEAIFARARAPQPLSNLFSFSLPASISQPIQGVLDLAASSESSTLRRLPRDWKPRPFAGNVTTTGTILPHRLEQATIGHERPRAERSRRILGMAVHMLFEQAAKLLRQDASLEIVLAKLPQFRNKAASFAWNEGLTRSKADSCAEAALAALQSALQDEVGLWILGPRREAQTESSWTGILDGATATLRIDRSFQAGDEPLSERGETLWIVDYKTATHSASGVEEFLDSERLQYQDQLERYGRMMRLAKGPGLGLNLGLYYPMLRRLLWWSQQ